MLVNSPRGGPSCWIIFRATKQLALTPCTIIKIYLLEINAHYYLHPYFNIYMHQIIKGLWRRSYPRKDSCGIGTHKVEIQPTIDLVEYGGLWPACGGGKSGGYRRDDGCGLLSLYFNGLLNLTIEHTVNVIRAESP